MTKDKSKKKKNKKSIKINKKGKKELFQIAKITLNLLLRLERNKRILVILLF